MEALVDLEEAETDLFWGEELQSSSSGCCHQTRFSPQEFEELFVSDEDQLRHRGKVLALRLAAAG